MTVFCEWCQQLVNVSGGYMITHGDRGHVCLGSGMFVGSERPVVVN